MTAMINMMVKKVYSTTCIPVIPVSVEFVIASMSQGMITSSDDCCIKDFQMFFFSGSEPLRFKS